jgi:predicted ATPase
LLTKLHDASSPSLLLCDDLERGLHLGAQVELARLIRRLLISRPDLQLVATTHSPYLASLFEPEEVLVMALDEERRTHAAWLTEHPDFEELRHGFQTGELWAALGEDWVVEVSRKRRAA